MKKLITLMLTAGLLAACGNDDPEKEKQTEIEQPVSMPEVEEMEEGVFEHEMDEYKTLATYNSDENTEIKADFEGYVYTFQVSAIENTATEEQYIALIGETENRTDEPVQFNSDILIVTDQQEQTTNEDGVGLSQPTVIMDAFVLAPIKRGVPNSFTMKLDAPFKVEGEDSYADSGIDPIDYTFTKQ